MAANRAARIVPVILSGGVGSRLWPLSRTARPKQLLPLVGSDSMMIETALRCRDASRFTAPMIICNSEHRFAIAEQFRTKAITPGAIILEPEGRNTAPAALVAACEIARQYSSDDLMLIMPSDHAITDAAAFVKAIDAAAKAAGEGALVTFGMTPTSAATGYGYIQANRDKATDLVANITKFVEKPDLARAQQFLKAKDYFWNSGLFLFSAQSLLAEAEILASDMLHHCRKSLELAKRDSDFTTLDATEFAQCEKISLDYAIMEKTKLGKVVIGDFGWSDVGAFDALWTLLPKDRSGNALHGTVETVDSHNNLLHSDGQLLTAVGLEDHIVIATTDAVLVVPKSRAQEVKTLVDRLTAQQRPEVTLAAIVERPWGTYQSIATGIGFQAKVITVKPAQKLSLQKHQHRAEHWVIVQGEAIVTRDSETHRLKAGDYIFLPLGCVHRLENPGSVLTVLVEVQVGSYTGEDDIIRLEDIYGRTKTS